VDLSTEKEQKMTKNATFYAKGICQFLEKNLFSITTMHNNTEKPFFGDVLCIFVRKKPFFPLSPYVENQRNTKISYFI